METPQLMAAPVGAAEAEKRCGVCQSSFAEGELAGPCPHCAAMHHAECWEEMGGCSSYGCDLVQHLPKQAEQPKTFWGSEEKACPSCSKSIKVAALRCRHCGSVFEASAPEAPRRAPSSTSYVPVAILAFGLLPPTAPLTLLAGGIWSLTAGKKVKLKSFQKMMVRIGMIAAVSITALFTLTFLMMAAK